ncbi:PREDICTED: exportin-6-like isoform X2 [Priapulus caudatus]|nr:PREDICTED: exportin-6-like isoform X2 [Priapulus caudatus]
MEEFFSPTTTNEKKRQIEELLNNFSQQRGSWKHCLYFLTNTSNEYVMMFCLTVIENIINRQWISFAGPEKMELRGSLSKFMLSHHDHVPSFIRNKLVKLVVDIGRLDWPHFYPDFFTSIMQLVQQPQTMVLGLILIKTTSEEMISPREDLSVSRKEELRKLLLDQMAIILGNLTVILESTLEKHRHLATATPPPSPSRDSDSRDSLSMFSTSPLHSDDVLSKMFKSLHKDNLESLPPLDADSQSVCMLVLECLSHLFSWIPLSAMITSNLLAAIFHFASFGCEPNLSSCKGTELGVLAMTCINEIMAKNCVPADFEEFLLQMFQQTFQLLQRLTRENTSNVSGSMLTELNENYIEKFTDFLHLFVSIHLRRFESNNRFPVLEFLALLFKYTFKQPTNEGFYNCLEIWSVFLDYLDVLVRNRSVDKLNLLDRYKEALASLVTQLLRKLQFRYNQSQLEELDDETVDDDAETEWQQFLRRCLEVVAKVAELAPDETFALVYRVLQENMVTYLGLEHHIKRDGDQRSLTIKAENDCRRLHCALRDLSSFLQALGRLAHQFIGELLLSRMADGLDIVKSLCHAALYGSKMKLYEITTLASVLQPDFTEANAQTLAALKAYSHWVAQYYAEMQRQGKENDQLATLVTSTMEAITPMLQDNVPEKIMQSAAHLLLSVATTIRPSFLLALETTQTLFTSVSQGALLTLPIQVQLLVYRSLSNVLLLPWPNVPDGEQKWHMRAEHHQNFIKTLMSQYRQLRGVAANDHQLQQQVKPGILQSLKVLGDIVMNVSGEVTKTKQLCYQSVHDCVQVTLHLFPIYIHHPDVSEEMLSFFLALFQSLRVQMGVPFAEQMLETFITLFTKERLAESISHDNLAGIRVVEKFLKILDLIVEEPGSAFKGFLPSIISLCMNEIYPIIAERPSPDVKAALFALLYSILQNNWRYFFKSNILSGLSPQAGAAGNSESEMEHQDQFTAVMQAFGQSFLQPDIAVFKQNIEYLEKLNAKWKLYHKPIFQQMMLFQFLNVLLQVLIYRSHDLLQEEIMVTVYNMAAVDFDRFYNMFLHQFLANCEGLDDSQKTMLARNFPIVQDLPSLSSTIHRFVGDLRYYRLCNSSLPEGSVKF